jgi:hypothetical protein
MFMISGCNKIDLEDRSKITITGNVTDGPDINGTYGIGEGYYSGPYAASCENIPSETAMIFILEPMSELNLRLVHASEFPVPEGTYYAADQECEAGVIAYLTFTTTKKAVYNFGISSGTMKIKDDDGTADIGFDFTISPASGGGRLTGNFTGTVAQATIR